MRPLPWLWALVPAFACHAGCTGDSASANPAPVAQADAAAAADAPSVDADAEPEAQPPPEAGVLKRRVYERSPFGNLDHAGDLLMDPDFEFSAGQGQTPWVAIDDAGQARLVIETGGNCRSGLRCLKLEGGTAVYGGAIGATVGATQLSFWTKVSGGSCDVLTAYFVRGMTGNIAIGASIKPVAEAPDADGWCRFEGRAFQQDEALNIYLELKSVGLGAWAIVDDASLRPADGMSALSQQAPQPVDEAVRVRIEKRVKWLRDHRWYGRPTAFDLGR